MKAKLLLLQLLLKTGALRIPQYLTRHHPLVMVYHRFSDKKEQGKISVLQLRQHFKLLKKYFKVISLEEFYKYTIEHKNYPDNSVVITVDDGYADFYQHAFPVFKEFNFPATLFVATDFVEKKKWLWHDKLHYIMAQQKEESVQFKIENQSYQFDLSDAGQKNSCWNVCSDYCMELQPDLIDKFLDNFASICDVSVPNHWTTGFEALTWEQIRELSQNNIEIGSHSASHQRMVLLDDKQLRFETVESKKILEKQVRKKINAFCYPFGRKADINRRVKQAVEDAGYKYATIGYYNANNVEDILEIKRVGADSEDLYFLQKLFGIELLKSFYRNHFNDR